MQVPLEIGELINYQSSRKRPPLTFEKEVTTTMGDKSVKTLGNKIDFRASWTQFSPSLPPPPQTMLIFLFL